MSPLTVPQVRRLLLAPDEPPLQRRIRVWWSGFRRQHPATALRCHAARRAREQPPLLTGASMRRCSVTCDLDDALWDEIAPLLPASRRRGDEPPLASRGMVEAAATASLPPTQLGFLESLRLIREALPDFQRTAPHDHPRIYWALLANLVAAALPPHANRINPRVVKQKMSNFPVKGAQHHAWPQPTKPLPGAILLLN